MITLVGGCYICPREFERQDPHVFCYEKEGVLTASCTLQERKKEEIEKQERRKKEIRKKARKEK